MDLEFKAVGVIAKCIADAWKTMVPNALLQLEAAIEELTSIETVDLNDVEVTIADGITDDYVSLTLRDVDIAKYINAVHRVLRLAIACGDDVFAAAAQVCCITVGKLLGQGRCTTFTSSMIKFDATVLT